MDTIKEIFSSPSGKALLTLLVFVVFGLAAEQAWWTYAAPKGALRCTETFSGIVCIHKK